MLYYEIGYNKGGARGKVNVPRCPYCGDTQAQVKAGHNRVGTQVYRCNPCWRRYVANPKIQRPDPKRVREAFAYRAKGWTYQAIGDKMGVSNVTIYRWLSVPPHRQKD